MSKIAIKAENISKQYRLGEIGTGTISHDLNRWWNKIRGKEDPFLKIGEINDRSQRGQSDYVWSLKDINFEINQGDAVGIIGRNGAGKSTLLKLLSKVTRPTTGQFKVNGRIASLLEVGTGFHPEMTGRENIYLNGAILGMRRSEITSKFDEIVDFAGIERYIDTPVKRYSSGMYVRLAFAVAAHLESEILIVDEVLAVGDADFQKKCLGKMDNISKGEGRTVLFVSHNMASITQLCNSGILIDNGKVSYIGSSSNAVLKYISTNTNNSYISEFKTGNNSNNVIGINKAWITDINNIGTRNFTIGQTILFNFELEKFTFDLLDDIQASIQIAASDGVKICNIIDKDSGFTLKVSSKKTIVQMKFTDLRFYPDVYFVSIWVGTRLTSIPFDRREDCLSFEILNGGELTTRDLPRSAGLFYFNPEWNVINV
jgi:lipopolysaccharide transport system ATP-binding protein